MSLPAQLHRTRRFTLGVPERLEVAGGGAVVLFLRGRSGDDPHTCLWAVDLGSGATRMLADPLRLAGRDRAGDAAIEDYTIDARGELAAFAVSGRLWTARVADGRLRRLPADGPVVSPRLDPTGRHVGYGRDGALLVIDVAGGGEQVLAAPDGPDVVFGHAEQAGRSVLDGDRACWWSPKGARLLAARVDSAPVARWRLADPANPAAAPRVLRYPAAGAANAEVTLWLVALDGSRVAARWDREAFEYVPAAGWDEHGPYALVQSRDQTRARLLGFDPASGAAAVLAEWRAAPWFHVVPGLPARTRAGAVVAHVDHGETRRLTIDGEPVTPPDLCLRAAHGVEGERVLFTASAEPTETHLYCYHPAEGVRRLSDRPGVHSGVWRDGVLIRVARRLGRPGGQVTASRGDGAPLVIPALVERPELDLNVTCLTLGPRQLRAALYLPRWHEPRHGRLPVLLDPYGGAAKQLVTAELTWERLLSQWLAEQGFAVLVADGRGTPGRGPAWEHEAHGDLYGAALDDQVTAVREAARAFPELDLARVGIRGWSYGGSLAAAAVLRRPDVFHAAVAGAPVTDQRLFDLRWRERFLGHPDEHPDRYAADSLVMAAPLLRRPLLLMHGLADEVVHPANTLRLSAALTLADRPHEVVLLPGVGHRAIGSAVTEALMARQVEFLRRHLGRSPPR